MSLDYAYIYDETDQTYVPRIASGVFKGTRVDHLPCANNLKLAYLYLQALPFVTVIEQRPTRIYFDLVYSETIGTGSIKEQRHNTAVLLCPEFGSLRF